MIEPRDLSHRADLLALPVEHGEETGDATFLAHAGGQLLEVDDDDSRVAAVLDDGLIDFALLGVAREEDHVAAVFALERLAEQRRHSLRIWLALFVEAVDASTVEVGHQARDETLADADAIAAGESDAERSRERLRGRVVDDAAALLRFHDPRVAGDRDTRIAQHVAHEAAQHRDDRLPLPRVEIPRAFHGSFTVCDSAE